MAFRGSLTELRNYGARMRALRAMLEPGVTPEQVRALAEAAGFAPIAGALAGDGEEAAPLPAASGATPAAAALDSRRRDWVDTARAILGRERALHFRILLQAAIGVVLTVAFATAASPVTHVMSIVAAFVSIPTWTLALGAPDAIAAALLSSPIAGAPARQFLHARLLAVLGLYLGAGADPSHAKAWAEAFVGAALPDPVVTRALAPSGSFAGRVTLREESEGALLRASLRLERSAAIRVRMYFLAVAAITLGAVFAPTARQMLQLGRGAQPVPTHIEEEERPGTILLEPQTTGTAG